MSKWHSYYKEFYDYAKQCGVGDYWADQGAIDYAEKWYDQTKKMRVVLLKGKATYHNK